jgi:hypothetical protein
MPDYRVYCVDGAGQIDLADWIPAATHEEAIMKARELRPDAHKCELWLGDQMIAKINEQGRLERLNG